MSNKIIIGSDHGGFRLKSDIITHLKNNGYEVDDLGCYTTESCDYPVIAKAVAEKVLTNSGRGILVCGTGIGVSITANRYDGIRASHCTDTFTARMTRMHNDSNILCLGERITGAGLALDIVDIWLNTEFEGGRHQKRIDMI
ncbi:MAG: ribose 5-phosphate isomerase B [Cyanobacteria bacterium SIG28]|nr:ribose 5-phosphate isomerase B [Cyanobacteria bacterium SIG28]